MKHITLFWTAARGLLAAALFAGGAGTGAARTAATFVVTKVADTADGVCDSDCSLREAIIAANNAGGVNTISIPAGTFSLTRGGPDEDAASTGDLDIKNGTLTLTGAGEANTVLSAGGLDRMIDVLNGAQVQISGVTIQDGLLSNNFEVPGSGAAIRVLAGSLSLSHVKLSNNRAILYGGAILYGFEIPFNSGSPVGLLRMDHVEISDNIAPAAGGGVFLGQGARMEISDSTIRDNSTIGNNVVPNSGREGGGGIFVLGGAYSGGVYVPSAVTIVRSAFTHNISSNDWTSTGGGAIYAATTDTTVAIADSAFSGNGVRSGPGGFAGSGGAIYNDGATFTVTNSTFDANDSITAGGGLSVYAGRLAILDSALTNNTARGNNPFGLDCGGALKAVNGTVISIDNTTVASNTAQLSGGGICLKAVEGTLNHLRVYGNSARIQGVGGGLFNTSRAGSAAESPVRVMNSFIHHNSAVDGRGGGIANVSGGALELSDSVVSENSAAKGGGIDHYIGFSIFVTNTRILSNTADEIGGGVNTRNDTGCSNNICPRVPQFTDVTIQGNRVISDGNDTGGGGIYNMVSLRLNRVTISRNEAQQGGGILSFHNGTGDFPNGVEAVNVTLSGNTAHDAGGGAYIALGVATFNNATIVDNSAFSAGGGIFSDGNFMPTVVVSNTIIANNGASDGADCGGTFVSGDYNLIESMFGCTMAGPTISNNITAQDPNLGPLADNGGATWTHALLIGSPAINHGNPAGGACAAGDQRQAARSGVCDIGAYEYGVNAPTPTPTATATPTRTPTATATVPGQATSTATPTVPAIPSATPATPGGGQRHVYMPLVRR